MQKLIEHFKKNKIYYLTFLISFSIITILYIIRGITPFGDSSVLKVDFLHQYGPMLGEFYDRVRGGDQLIYSFNMGMPFIRNFMNYLSSPFNLIIFLFNRENLVMVFSLLIALKVSLASTAMVYYLSKRFDTKTTYLIPFGILYAFSAWFIAYYYNVMWLDALVFLPLIILGIEKIINENKGLLYIGSLTVLIIANFSVAFMVCLFLPFYFIAYLLIKTDKWNPKEILEKSFLFIVGSLLAAGLASILLIPLIFGLNYISATSTLLPTQRMSDFTFIELLANKFSGVNTVNLPNLGTYGRYGIYLPNMSVGVLSVVLGILFFINKSIKLKEKLIYAGLLSLFIISFFSPLLDFIWHGFHVPNGFPFRYSFIYSFIMIIISCYSLLKIDKVPPNVVCIVYVLVMLLIGLLRPFNFQNISMPMIILNWVLLSSSFIIYILYKKKLLKMVIPIILIVIVSFEVIFSANHNWAKHWQGAASINTLQEDYQDIRNAVNIINKNDPDVFRIERLMRTTFNDGSWFNFPTTSISSSMAYENVARLHTKLGNRGNDFNIIIYMQTTPIHDLIFNVRYTIGKVNDRIRPIIGETNNNPIHYRFYENNQIVIYRNEYHVGLMFGVNNNILNWEINHENPFIIQNDFIYQATGISQVLKEITYFNREIIFNEGEWTFVRYSFENPGDNIYFQFYNRHNHFILNNQIHATFPPIHDITDKYETFDITDTIFHGVGGHIIPYETTDDITTLYVMYQNYQEKAFRAYTIDHALFSEAVTKLRKNLVEIDTFKEYYIRGTVSTEEPLTIFTSIPFNGGWEVTVNGEKVETFRIGETFLGFEVDTGEHEIVLRYRNKGMLIGSLITVSSLMIILVGIKYRKL